MTATVTKLKIRIGERELTVKGRVAWALDNLVRAGARGVTPLDFPTGCRVAHYVFKLRRDGVGVSTVNERHAGAFAGRHARYVLASPVEILAREVKP